MALMIGQKLPVERRNLVGFWATQICKSSDLSNSKVAKYLVFLALTLTSPPTDLVIAQSMAKELLGVVGSENVGPLNTSEIFPLINKSTAASIASTILQLIESSIVDMEWITIRLKTYYTATQKGISSNQTDRVAPELAVEEMLYSRAEAIVKVLSHFVAMNLKGMESATPVSIYMSF